MMRGTFKRSSLIFQLIILIILVVVLILLVTFLKPEKKTFIQDNKPYKAGEMKERSHYYSLPYIFDSKAVLKAQYLNLSNYEPLKFIKCLSDLSECSDLNLKITAYLYKEASEEFCSNLNKELTIGETKVKIENLEDVKEVCKVFYKIKEKKLEKKDCVSPITTPICDYYFSLKGEDFIKSNLQLLNLISNPEMEVNCLSLEKSAAYYCLNSKGINCNSFEDPEEVEKCNKLLVNHDSKYLEFLQKVENIIKNRNWEELKELILKTEDPKLLHSLARLGAINREICDVFLEKDEKEYKYCLKRYSNQNFLCEISSDKRQCLLFDVILNDKDCSLLKNPQHVTDCELFKKYINKKDCNFFYTVAADKYLGYLCAVKTGRCDDKAYYDEMYKINCKYLTGQI